jgi:starvation-inducible DNA-binding protein
MMDLLAERVVQLGGTAKGTIQVAAKGTELKIYPLHISGERDRIDALSSALAAHARVRVAPSERRARRQGHRR